MKAILAVAMCLAVLGCVLNSQFNTKTQRERDVDACTYGAIVPHNIPPEQRSTWIKTVSVPACLRAKGYSDEASR